MKQISFYLFTLLLSSLILISCDDSSTDPDPLPTEGELQVSSTPAGAAIYVNNKYSNFVTPHNVTTPVGNVDIKLSLENYLDTTFVVSISGQDMGIVGPVVLVPEKLHYGLVKVWDTRAPSTNQPSGVDLSSGAALPVSIETNRDIVDIYYTGTNLTIASADLNEKNNLTRKTYFQAGSGTNINDGIDSPTQNSNWSSSMPDDVGVYYFLYDTDGNYSKFRIVNTSEEDANPAWVEVEWYYVKAKDENKF